MLIERWRCSCVWGIGYIWMICCIEILVNIEYFYLLCDIWWFFKRIKYLNFLWLVLVYEVIIGINMVWFYLCVR